MPRRMHIGRGRRFFVSERQRRWFFANRNLSFAQLRRKGIKLSRGGDFDNDGVSNIKDCQPLNPLRQEIPEKPKRGRKYWTCTFRRDGEPTWAGISTTKKEAEFRCQEIQKSQFAPESKTDFKVQKLRYPDEFRKIREGR